MLSKLGFRSRLMKDSFIYDKSRKSATRNIISVTICITIAIIVSLLIATILGYNPFEVISDLFTKGFIDKNTLIWNISVLGLGALAFSFAFRAGIFNIGIPGQMLAAGITVLAVTTALDKAGANFGAFGPIFSLLVGIAAGAFVGTFTAVLKVYLNVNEVVSSILLNWIIYFATRLIVYQYFNPGGSVFAGSTDFPQQFQLVIGQMGGWIPTLIIFIGLTLIILFVNNWTTFGHKVLAVGYSKSASRYAGYNQNAIHISTMAISGGLVGVMAIVLYTSGQAPSMPFSYDYDALPVQGFNGIAIALIALNNPLAILPVAALMGLFTSSASFITPPNSFYQVIMGTIILGAALFVITTKYKPWLWFMKRIYGPVGATEFQNKENKMESLIAQYRLKLGKSKDKNEIDNLKNQYLNERKNLMVQYKKHLLIMRATQAFFPKIAAQNIIDTKINEYQTQLLKFENRQIRHISSMNDDQNNKYNALLVNHVKLFKKYDLAKALTINRSSKLKINKFIKYIAIQNQKKTLFNLAIQNTIKNHKKFLTIKSDLMDMKKENLERFKIMINSFQEMIKKDFENKFQIMFFINDKFQDFPIIDKIKIFYYYLISRKDFKNIKTIKGKLIRIKQSDLLPTYMIHKLIYKFNLKIDKSIQKYKLKENKIDNTKIIDEEKLLKAKHDVEVWSQKTTTHYTKYYDVKQRLSGSLIKRYKNYLKKAKKIGLENEELVILEQWLQDSYNQSIQN